MFSVRKLNPQSLGSPATAGANVNVNLNGMLRKGEILLSIDFVFEQTLTENTTGDAIEFGGAGGWRVDTLLGNYIFNGAWSLQDNLNRGDQVESQILAKIPLREGPVFQEMKDSLVSADTTAFANEGGLSWYPVLGASSNLTLLATQASKTVYARQTARRSFVNSWMEDPYALCPNADQGNALSLTYSLGGTAPASSTNNTVTACNVYPYIVVAERDGAQPVRLPRYFRVQSGQYTSYGPSWTSAKYFGIWERSNKFTSTALGQYIIQPITNQLNADIGYWASEYNNMHDDQQSPVSSGLPPPYARFGIDLLDTPLYNPRYKEANGYQNTYGQPVFIDLQQKIATPDVVFYNQPDKAAAQAQTTVPGH